MLRGFHVIFSAYRFWLPNDPRGSWSDWIRKWELLQYGAASKVDTRRSVARVPHDAAARRAAKQALAFPEVILNGLQAGAVGQGMAKAVTESDYRLFACSIMPQHVHFALGPNERRVPRIVGHLKARATQQLIRQELHPLAGYKQKDGTTPSPWARNCWKVFIPSDRHLREAIQYVEENPLKEGKPRQRWPFVTRPEL